MSLTQKNANALLLDISKSFNVDIDELYKLAGDRVKRPNAFASSKAKSYCDEVGADVHKIKPTGKGGKITIDDIRKCIGEEPKKKINLFASTAARKLAEENDLKIADFSPEERTGRRLKSNNQKTITVEDCRKKLGLEPKKTTTKKVTKKTTKKTTKKSDSDSDSSSSSDEDN